MLLLNGQKWDGWKTEAQSYAKPKKAKEVLFNLGEFFQGRRLVDDRWIVTFPKELLLEATYVFNDDRESGELRYTTGPTAGKSKDGSVKYAPLDGLVFINGVLTVNPADTDLLFWLRNHPRNKTNGRYFKTDGSVNSDTLAKATVTTGFMFFKEKDEVKEKELAYDKEAKVIDAKYKLKNECTQKEVDELFMSYEGGEADTPLKLKKSYLLQKISEDPIEFMRRLDGDVRSLKALISQAIQGEVIKFDRTKRLWTWADNNKEFLKTAKNRNEEDELFKYLQESDDGELRKKLTELVKELDAAVGV